MTPAEADTLLQDCVERTLSRLGKRLVMGLPLGLGKPNALVNAFYRRARKDASISLEIVTALSLDPPQPRSDLEARFLGPFVARHFGADYPRLDYVADLSARRLPDNIRITEFYLQSGSRLGNPLSQRHYVSSNYTHVARDLVDRGVNLALQLVAEGVLAGERRLSLSCNPDVTLELKTRLAQRPQHRCLLIGQCHPELPFMHGEAVVAPAFFDEVLPATHDHRLFALPRTPVQRQDHWVGLHASRLVADGGTLQIGIGSLSDALVHALRLRQRDNPAYRRLLGECGIDSEDAACRLGGLEPFEQGLYGASEMFMDGFMHLYRAGILRREVFDDETLQAQANAGTLPASLRGTGALMDGGFFLGSRLFYDFLQALEEHERPRFRMQPVSRINQLYGGSERLEITQRRRARFINSGMMVTLTGAVASDTLADHQVVSGVGGQYNFVAMAHAMEDGRSVMMLRSTRGEGKGLSSNIVWEYPQTTLPRHLRDLVVTEYGVADLRGRTDEECIQALLCICDARFQEPLAARAKTAGKLAASWQIPEHARGNLPERLARRSEAERQHFLAFPFGSDFTEIEQRLLSALQRLKGGRYGRLGLARAALTGRPSDWQEALARMGMDAPEGLRQRLMARALAAALDDG